MMPCLILAGGKGVRLGSLTKNTPKPLLPVLGKPFLSHVFRMLASQGVTDLVVSVSYLADQFRASLGDGRDDGVRVRWIDEGSEPLGTGGCIRYCLEQLDFGRDFFVMYGDTYLQVDFADVENVYRASGCPALMTVMRNEGRWDQSNTEYEDGRVSFYSKDAALLKQRNPQWIDYGLMAMNREVILSRVPPTGACDLAPVLTSLSREGTLAGYPVTQRFYEIGTPGGIAELEQWLNKGH